METTIVHAYNLELLFIDFSDPSDVKTEIEFQNEITFN